MRIQHKILEEISEEHKLKINSLEATVAQKGLDIDQLRSTIDTQAKDKAALDQELEDLHSIIARKELELGGAQEAALKVEHETDQV